MKSYTSIESPGTIESGPIDLWILKDVEGNIYESKQLPIDCDCIGNTRSLDPLCLQIQFPLIINASWDFNKYKYCPIRINGKWGFIDNHLNVIVKPMFDFVGEEIEYQRKCYCPPEFDHITEWRDGFCQVIYEGEDFLIDNKFKLYAPNKQLISSFIIERTDLLIERGSNYSYKIEHAKEFSFRTMMKFSIEFVNSLEEDQKAELFAQLNRGLDMLSSEPQMNMYLFAYGNMHEAKLKLAFENMGEDYKKLEDFAIVDYGCGQGLASITLYDHMKALGLEKRVNKIILIEPSDIALKRAALHVSKAFPSAEIITIKKHLDELSLEDISSGCTMSFHIFSNILDIESISIEHLVNIVNEENSKNKIMVCVGPNFGNLIRNKRFDDFCGRINANKLFWKECIKGEWINDWSCKISVYFYTDNKDFEDCENDIINCVWQGHEVTIDESFGYIICDGEPEWLIDIKDKLENAFIDEWGVKYSEDKTVLYDCNCRGIKEYHVLEGTLEIRTKAFFTANIDKLILPKSLKKIGFRGVYSYGVREIEVSKDNQYFSSFFGALYNKDLSKLIALPMGANKPCYCFPSETVSVEKGVFCTYKDTEHRMNAQWHISINPDVYDEATLCSARECEFLQQFQTLVRYPYCVVARFKDENIIADVVTHTHSTTISGAVYDYKKETLLYYPPGMPNKSLHICEGCKIIKEDAFRPDLYFNYINPGFDNIYNQIEDIYLPSSLVSIQGNPFMNCPKLKRIFIKDDKYDQIINLLAPSLQAMRDRPWWMDYPKITVQRYR